MQKSRSKLNKEIKKFSEEINHLSSFNSTWLHLNRFAKWFVWVTGLNLIDWITGGMIVGTITVVLLAVPTVAIIGQLLGIFIGLGIIFICGWLSGSYLLYHLRGKDLRADLDMQEENLKWQRKRLAELTLKREEAENEYLQLLKIQDARKNYNEAKRNLEEIRELLKSKRFQLYHSDWRALRGIDFERFVSEVFEILGYSVDKTKATGDQGVDLIMHRKSGPLIAVQVKGYEGSVGNKPVQEVFTGMKFYNCSRCMAITNSSFTRGAWELASTVECVLIEGSDIGNLISGQMHLKNLIARQLHFKKD